MGMNERQKRERYLALLEEKKKRNKILLAKKNLINFTMHTYEEYEPNWHHELVASKLDKFINKEIKNLMIFMPPQNGKSELGTRRMPAKLLGERPNDNVAIVAYNHTYSSKFNRDVQRIIDTQEYHELYPGTTLNSSNVVTVAGSYLRNSEEFEIVGKKGGLVSVGIGGGLTGRRVDVGIIDDPYKDAQDAWSHNIREKIQDWYNTVFKTRLHKDSQQLIILTRWHEEDLAGYILKTESKEWDVVVLEAIKTNKTNVEGDNRNPGEALWPERHTLEDLQKIKENNSVVFESLYQQNPTPKEGLLLNREELNWYSGNIKDKLGEPDGIISKVDTADQGDDYLSHPIGYIYGDDVYIDDVNFTQEGVEVTEPLVAGKIIEHKIEKCDVESNNGGKGFKRNVENIVNESDHYCHITDTTTTKNKHTRILMKAGYVKKHFHFREDMPEGSEYSEYIKQILQYPKNGKVKHDDAIDSTVGLAELMEATGIVFLI